MKHTLSAFLLTATAAHAQFALDWATTTGGTGSGTAGSFAMRGSIGLTDSASGIAGTFEFFGGFWSLLEDASPSLRMFRAGLDLVLAWPNPSSGFQLQSSPDTTSWIDVTIAPVVVGDEKQVIWGPLTDQRQFFRLHSD